MFLVAPREGPPGVIFRYSYYRERKDFRSDGLFNEYLENQYLWVQRNYLLLKSNVSWLKLAKNLKATLTDY